ARYVGIGVGKRWGRSFMKLAAGRSGGRSLQINPDEQVSWKTFELISTLNTPQLLDLNVLDDRERSWLRFDETLAQGEELCAVIRLKDGDPMPESVVMTGTLDGETIRRTYPIRGVASHADYLPRTWAKLEIDRLLSADPQKNREQVISLSKSMYVMSPFTSLLVLEDEKMYAQFKVDRGRKDHWAIYPCPEQIPVVYEPDPSQPTPRIAPQHPKDAGPKKTKPKTETKTKPKPGEVLNTILVRVRPRRIYWPNRENTHANYYVLTAQQLYSGAYAMGSLNPGRWGMWNGNVVTHKDVNFRTHGEVMWNVDSDGDGVVETYVPLFATGTKSRSVELSRLEAALKDYKGRFGPLPGRYGENDRVTVGLSAPGVFSADLDIPFSNGSFPIANGRMDELVMFSDSTLGDIDDMIMFSDGTRPLGPDFASRVWSDEDRPYQVFGRPSSGYSNMLWTTEAMAGHELRLKERLPSWRWSRLDSWGKGPSIDGRLGLNVNGQLPIDGYYLANPDVRRLGLD
ncbi:MAG: hypothetical protein N2C14_13720, partial [Planctomycetales bacterium]